MSLTAEDRLEIHDLCARYYITTDEADVDGFMKCWTEDTDILFESEFGTFRGPEQIRAFEDEHVHRGMAIGKRHLLGNVSIREGEDANTAYVTSYMLVMEVADEPHIVATAIYRDSKAVRTADGWRFRHRRMAVDPGFGKLVARMQSASAAH
jgi:hypothetical protein